METLKVKLEVFEGPLDLLLHLIKTLEIDIYDIPIAEITVQYMNYIQSMKDLQLEVAGEYIVMAATLMSIKSKLLLPKQELDVLEDGEDSEGEDPRDALVAQLLEYRKFKYAADVLKDKEAERSLYYTKEPLDLSNYKDEMEPLKPDQVSTIDLFLAFHDVLERSKLRGPKETTITTDTLSIEEQIKFIEQAMEDLPENKGLSFDTLFVTYSRGEIVTTFMALLELIKARRVTAQQENHLAPIYLYTYSEELE
ncbi:segregation/condensation protein A [Vagococcus elongatus]|uniref:Segregation and condensation protein A n=1 Tax=Vagococcus elongatus TaxID=180344 RepID=A0A430B5J0_9ENTE|nr:segregation/condensation protein A [Vagococcus elongatus]RSU15569.1 segregation/condensation protein A [Vagococcus elongatus]